MLRRFREFLQWRQGDAIILAEANVLPGTDMEYFGDAGALRTLVPKMKTEPRTGSRSKSKNCPG